jgi:hypothetical protein
MHQAGAGATNGDRRMSIRNVPRPSRRGRLADSLFVGGCTAVYVILVIAVIAAVRAYGV